MEQDLQKKIFLVINSLTEKVNILYMEREQQDVQQTQAMDVQDSENYPRLLEAIPSLETNFFRSSIPDEKKKIIYECSKFLGTKYTPPPLNKAATPDVRKNNAALYDIQMALANMTRPLDDYIHNKLNDPATSIKSNDYLEFAHVMQELLSAVASNISQARIETLHESMELSGEFQQNTGAERKAPFVCARRLRLVQHMQQRIPLKTPSKPQPIQQITSRRIRVEFFKQKGKQELSVKPQMRTTRYVLSRLDQTHRQKVGQKHSGEGIQDSVQKSESGEAKGFDEEKLYKFQSNKCKATYSGEIKKFFGREAKFSQKNEQGSQQCNNQGGCGSSSKECNRTEYRKHTSSSRPPETQQLRREEKFQNGIPNIHMQDDQKKILHDLSGSRGRFYAHSDTSEMQEIFLLSMEWKNFLISSPTFWTLTESPYLYKGTTPSFELNSGSGNQNLGSESSIKQSEGPQTKSQQTIKSGQANTQKFG
ncbi:hypothetical protein BB561_002899 [Smittium simulii]|uniref:Uncharacterized protein n=1 Tax=Smittium simulii TaxID=133385 RepID=A0A2T9YP02_9FUNG|nr:hypothetical protein BB561_002899 [Smittium simulii]